MDARTGLPILRASLLTAMTLLVPSATDSICDRIQYPMSQETQGQPDEERQNRERERTTTHREPGLELAQATIRFLV
jgi:hypothetical protein